MLKQNSLIFYVLRFFKFSFFPWISKKIFALSFLVYENPAFSDSANCGLTSKAYMLVINPAPGNAELTIHLSTSMDVDVVIAFTAIYKRASSSDEIPNQNSS